MSLSTLEAYDLVRFADHLQQRLSAAQAELSPKRGLKSEKEWLAAAEALLASAREPAQGLLEKVRGLPELAEVRDEYAAEFQGQWVDALERLLAGITFHLGNRDPLIEALFPHSKLAVLRRAGKDDVLDFAKELDRRQRSSYVTRMLAQPSHAFAAPVLELTAQTFSKWKSAFQGEGMPEEEAANLRGDLMATAKKIEVFVKQARLLAEAALAPLPDLFEELGLAAKPKKRTKPSQRPAKELADPPAEEASSVAAEPAEPPAVNEGSGEAAKPKRRRPSNGTEAEVE